MPPPNRITPTFQKILDKLKSDATLSKKEATELSSAIRRFAVLCGKHPADIIADPAVVRDYVEKANWQLAGLTKQSWANLKTRLTRAMKYVGIKVHRRRRNYKLLPEWDVMFAAMSRRDRDELHRFAGWCSTYGIQPNEVDQSTFDRFLAELEAQSIQQNPRERCHIARRVWNKKIAVADSCFPKISGGVSTPRRALPLTDFAPQLVDELNAYSKAVTSVSPLDLGERKPIKPVTLQGYVKNIRYYISDLVKNGVSPSELTTLAACTNPALVKRGLEIQLAGRELDEKTRPGLSTRMVAILSVANHVGVAADDMSALQKLLKKVRHMPDGMCERNERRLAQFENPRALHAIITLPFVVANRYTNVSIPTIRDALEMQMAVLLAILLFFPVRIKNAASLDLDKHVRRPVGKAAGQWLVHFEPSEIKNAKAIDGTFNDLVSELLGRYVDAFRPVLLNKPSSSLFLSQHGTEKGPHVLGKQFSRFVKREIGLEVNPHLMRHFAAFVYLKANPGDYESVRQMLGHKNIASTVTFYAKASTLSALARYDEVVLSQMTTDPPKAAQSLKTNPKPAPGKKQ